MNKQIIYIVGRPNDRADILSAIHKYGYGLGVLLDKNNKLTNPGIYDRVIEVDFNDIDNEIQRLSNIDLNAIGLIATYENYIVAKSQIAEHFGLHAPSVKSAYATTDKLAMRQAFMDFDQSITPNFSNVSSLDECLIFVEKHGYPVMLKPTNLVKSLLVLKCESEAELVSNYSYASKNIHKLYEKYNIYDKEPALIIEEFVTGKQCSIAAFLDEYGNVNFCDSVVGLTTAQDIGINDNYIYKRLLPIELDQILMEKLFHTARMGLAALNLRSIPAHIELMYNSNEVKLIEIGARIGGYRPRMYANVYGLDLNDQEIRLAIGKQVDLKAKQRAFCAVYELFPEVVGKFEGLENDVVPSSIAYHRITIEENEEIGPSQNGYKAAAIVIVSEQSESVFNEKCQLVEKITVKIK